MKVSTSSMVRAGILAAILTLVGYFVSLPVAVLTLAFVSGAPLFTIMLGAAVLGAASLPRAFDAEFDGMSASILNVGLGDQVEVMSTIPLFIYAGYLLAEAGTADRLVRFANAALGWMPGGLAIVTILTCALFTVFTGASGVTIIALGGVLMPALVRNGYPERFSMGLIAGTGSVGLLFPPALPLFIYGTVCGLNVQQEWKDWEWDTGRFIFAGIVPGLVLVGMLSAVAVTVAIIKKLPRQKFSFDELARSAALALPELCIPFGVIIGLANGFGLPEIASLTVVYVVVLEVGVAKLLSKAGIGWGKSLDAITLWRTSREAMAMVGAIFIIIFASTALTNYMVTAQVPQALVDWTTTHVDSKIVFLLALNVILLIVGTVMDIFSAIVVVLPLVLRIAHAYHIDPYHLGVIFLLNLEVGYLHPPVGLNLFITSVKFQRPITEVMWATVPFLLTMIVALVTITYVPWLTVVPEAERTGTAHNLVVLVDNAFEEKRAVKEVTLVATDGTVLQDETGRPVVVKAAECEALEAGDKKAACQNVFFYADQCKAEGAKADECTHKKIGAWTARNRDIVVVQSIPLVDDDKNPVKDAKGQPTVMTYAACQAETDADKKTACRELFHAASSCKIDPQDKSVDGCTFDEVSKWVHENLSP